MVSLQEIIINLLLLVIAIASLVMFIVGRRPGSMTKKQKKVLSRILFATVILLLIRAAESLVPQELTEPASARIIRARLYVADYLIISYDIFIKAAKGIQTRRGFDEPLLLAVAPLGDLALSFFEFGASL